MLARDGAPDPSLPGSDPADEPAFRMLDTLREYGAERLHLAATKEIARRREAATGTGQAPGSRTASAPPE